MGGTGSGRKTTWDRTNCSKWKRNEVDRRLGHLAAQIKELRDSQTENQKYWLDLADGGLLIAQETMSEAIEKERLASRQAGSVEYFLTMALDGHRRLGSA